MRVFENVAAFTEAVGEDLGTSDWFTITQERVDQFADATGDHQWIHIDPERSAKGPFGRTIAHGYLTLSLTPLLMEQVYRVDDVAMGMNYGANKVRFPSPVPVGSRIRTSVTLVETKPIAIGTQFVVRATVECDASEKPVCVADIVFVLAGNQ